MKAIQKANLIVAFCEENLEDEEYRDFFDHNESYGIPLAISLSLGHVKLRSSGEGQIAYTWTELCSLLNADPTGNYESLDELYTTSKNSGPKVDIELSIDLNNDGHKALDFGDAELALEKWTSAAELGQPNAYTSLVWLNIFLNRFDQLDSIMSDYDEKTLNWRRQFDSFAGNPYVGTSQFDQQRPAVFYNCALSEWLRGEIDSAKRYLTMAGDDAEAKYLRHEISGESLEALELSESESNELIGIYEDVIADLERIESFDSSYTEPWDGKTFMDFAKTAIERLKTA
jgi:hypothetical protein